MHVVEFKGGAAGNPDRAVQEQRHLFERDFAMDEQFAVVTELARAAEDCAIVKRRKWLFGLRDCEKTELKEQKHTK